MTLGSDVQFTSYVLSKYYIKATPLALRCVQQYGQDVGPFFKFVWLGRELYIAKCIWCLRAPVILGYEPDGSREWKGSKGEGARMGTYKRLTYFILDGETQKHSLKSPFVDIYR